MSIVLDGTTGITTPGLINTGTETLVNLTTTGNTTLGDASGDTLTVTGGTTTFTQGTANGVAYLNGSKVLTTGTALAFNGSKLGIGTTSFDAPLQIQAITGGTSVRFNGRASPADGYSDLAFYNSANTTQYAGIGAANSGLILATNISSPILFQINSAEAGRFDSSGNLLVGSTNSNPIASGVSGAAFLSVGAIRISSSPSSSYMGITAASGTQVTFYTYSGGAIAAGTITCPTTNTTSYTSISDHRLKENIVPMTGALAKVAQLKPCTYDWINDKVKGQGFIAHELQAIVPDCVIGEKDAVDEEGKPQYQSIDTSFLVATLTAAIQEQQALITTLTNRITALENK